MPKKTLITLFLTVVLVSTACNRTRLKYSSDNTVGNIDVVKSCTVTYQEQIAPLMQNTCVKCHSAEGKASQSPFDTYSSVVSNHSLILKRATNKSMPPIGEGRYLTNEELSTLNEWISNGAPENKESCKVVTKIEPECTDRVPQVGRDATLLTKYEFLNTIKDVFGINAAEFAKNEINSLPADLQFKHNFDTSRSNRINYSLIEIYLAIGERVGSYFAQSGKLSEMDSCLIINPNDENACIIPLIEKLGLKAFRRPLETDEKESFLLLYREIKKIGLIDAIQTLVSTFIQSPKFIFHLELDLAGKTVNENIYLLSSFEVASRLSYSILGSIPDEALFSKAAKNELTSIEAIKLESQRLFSNPKSKLYTQHFFKQLIGTYSIPPPDASSTFLAGQKTEGLQEAAAAEMDAFILSLYDENKPFEDFFLSKKAYLNPNLVGSKYLQQIYGGGTQLGLTTLPENRFGYPTRVAYLLSSGRDAKPIIRGLNILRNTLCEHLPPPPAEAANAVLSTSPDLNTNDRAHALTSSSQCFSCHSRINPPGYLLASYDAIGRHRAVENLFDVDGNIVNTVPFRLDYIPAIDSPHEDAVVGPKGLMQALATNEKPLLCFASKRIEFIERNENTDKNRCIAKELALRVKKEGVKSLITEIITPEFNLRKVE